MKRVLSAMIVMLLLCLCNPAQGVMIDGKDWQQPDDYTNISYDDLALHFWTICR